MLEIRKTIESDLPAVLHVKKEALGNNKGSEIADLVNGLLNDPRRHIMLVAQSVSLQSVSPSPSLSVES